MKLIKILEDAIDYYGVKNQLVVATEEFSELSKELCKAYRADLTDYAAVDNKSEILEELADVIIMLTQIEMIFEFETEDVWEEVNRKIKRLYYRMNQEQEKERMILSADEFRAKAPLYYSWQRKKLSCARKIKEIEDDMASIPSPFPDRIQIKGKYVAVPKSHGDPAMKELKKLELIDLKASKEIEMQMYAEKIEEVDKALARITKAYDTDLICVKDIIERVYIRRNRIENVAAELGYSKTGLFDLMDKTLRTSLDPDHNSERFGSNT